MGADEMIGSKASSSNDRAQGNEIKVGQSGAYARNAGRNWKRGSGAPLGFSPVATSVQRASFVCLAVGLHRELTLVNFDLVTLHTFDKSHQSFDSGVERQKKKKTF